MKLIIILISLLTLFTSCKEETEAFTMYGLLQEEFGRTSLMLKSQIKETLASDKLIDHKASIAYDSLTNEYYNYLNNVTSDLIITSNLKDLLNYNGELSNATYTNSFFFEGDKLHQRGIEFISRMEHYKDQISLLIKDENLKKRVSLLLDTSPVRTKDGSKIEYLDFIYRDMPLISVIAHIRNKEKTILEFENNFLLNIQLNESP